MPKQIKVKEIDGKLWKLCPMCTEWFELASGKMRPYCKECTNVRRRRKREENPAYMDTGDIPVDTLENELSGKAWLPDNSLFEGCTREQRLWMSDPLIHPKKYGLNNTK